MPSKPVSLTPELLGARIAEALKTAGVSRERAADEIGRSRDTLDRYIRGHQNPSAIDVWTISQLTGHPFGWFGEVSDSRGGQAGHERAMSPPTVAEAKPPVSRRRRAPGTRRGSGSTPRDPRAE